MATSEIILGLVRGVVPNKTARTICLVIVLAALPLMLPRPFNWKGHTYRAMLPDLRELVSFKSNRSAPDTISYSNSTTDAPPARNPPDPCAADSIEDPTHA